LGWWPLSTGRSTRPRRRKRKLSQRILFFQLLILVVTGVIGFVLFALAQRAVLDDQYEQRALVIARITAGEPAIRTALAVGTQPTPTGVVQIVAQRIGEDSGASYVVVLDLHRIRHSSPDPAKIGQPVRRQLLVRDGNSHVRINATTNGRTANGLVPVYGPGRKLVGEASVGIPEKEATSDLAGELPLFGLYAGAALAVGALASFLLASRLKRSTFGLELEEIAGLFQDREATLHGIREGVVGFTAQGRVSVINNEARRLLGLTDDVEGRLLSDLGLEPDVTATLLPGRTVRDEMLTVGERLLVVSSWPTGRDGGPPGSVSTLRDSTELRLLSQKAETARRRLKLLYDASEAVGTTLDLTRTAEELARVGTPNFADYTAVDLIEGVFRGEEPDADGPARMRRVAVDGISAQHPFIPVGDVFDLDPQTPQAWAFGHEQAVLETDLTAATAWRAQHPAKAEDILAFGIHSRIVMPLHARGVLLGMLYFWRSAGRTAFDEDDLTLAHKLAARGAVCIDNARRYNREHTMAVTLQHNLLPHGMPDQNALDVAYRYLPAQSVGGDWFDFIALSGARVALSVGDVVGHGLHAAATMGRLRTAMHNFATLDLPPDELLSHMDDLVARIDQEEDGEGAAVILGATCVYAIYDPTTRICTMARAGHLPPALILPDGQVEFLDVPPGPPLGLTALPFQTAEFELPVGSRLVLYTDGLIEDRNRDIGESMEALRTALRGVPGSPDDTCNAVLEAMVPTRPSDDIALVVARTRALAHHRIASWDVPSDPAAVAALRERINQQLARWDLEELVFTTELILSELVTNAIRYAVGPIQVRLLRDRNLICEVSDGSSTSPHLRYAADTDEGGRGLFLVAQLAESWGTRYLATGKIIWAEQSIANR
jgi:serine phosphatase RsbU (regulator of sigma subunit)/PAS domain-containing protein/anti-sigma regulatory factor (Ser/Thr protein kinase)